MGLLDALKRLEKQTTEVTSAMAFQSSKGGKGETDSSFCIKKKTKKKKTVLQCFPLAVREN